MRVQKINKAFAYRVPIGDYNYLQCRPQLKQVTKMLTQPLLVGPYNLECSAMCCCL